MLVGGPAEAGERYRAQLGPYGDRLIVLTGQTPEQVVALTRRADVLVHPRLACRENYSVQSKIAVYLASGRPIVATDFGDYATILGDTGAGRLTAVAPEPLAEGILDVLTDPDLAARLSAATRPVAAGPLRHGPQHRPLPRRLPARPRHRPALRGSLLPRETLSDRALTPTWSADGGTAAIPVEIGESQPPVTLDLLTTEATRRL